MFWSFSEGQSPRAASGHTPPPLPPSRCEVCGTWPAEQAICAACLQAFCTRETPATPEGLACCVAAVGYAYPWSQLIQRFKFHGETGWAPLFAQVMLQTKGTVSLLEQTDWLLPVPMAPADLGHRGFNQSWLLCQALCRQIPHCTLRNTPLRTEPDALVKRVQTPSQHLLGRQERQKNLQHAFAVSPQARHRLSGLRVTLVDDILTTGATFEALARVLRQAGVAQVNGWALARTPAGDKEAAEAALC